MHRFSHGVKNALINELFDSLRKTQDIFVSESETETSQNNAPTTKQYGVNIVHKS